MKFQIQARPPAYHAVHRQGTLWRPQEALLKRQLLALSRVVTVKPTLYGNVLALTGHSSVNSRVCVGDDIVKRLSPGRICVGIQHSPKAHSLGQRRRLHSAIQSCQLDAAQPGVELRMCIAIDAAHFAVSRKLTAQQAGAEILQSSVTIFKHVVRRNVSDLRTNGWSLHVQLLAAEVALDQHCIQRERLAIS